MNWNEYLAKGYRALDNAHLHFNVEGGTFEFDNDRDARQGATILGRLYGFDNVIQSGFNVIVCEPEPEDLEEAKEEVIEETKEYKIVKSIAHHFKTVNGVARKGKDKEIYQVYFKTQDFNPSVNRWMDSGWSNSTAEFNTLEDARAFVKKYGKTLKDEVDEGVKNHYYLCSVYGGYNCQELLADNIEVYAKDEESAKKEAIKIYKQEYDYSKEDNPFGLEAKIIKDDEFEEDIEKHDSLNPKLFEGNELKPEVKEALIKVVDAFVEDLKDSDVDIKVKDAVVIGSNVNYNYTKDSDIDLHIIADSNDSIYPGELLTLLYSAYRSIFNKNYDIKIKGIPCEVYVELDEVHGISNGIYSLYNGWLKEPEQKNVPELDVEAFDKLFDEWEDKYFALLDEIGITPEEMLDLKETEENLDASEKVYDFIEDIYELRKESIANEGEFGLGNLVFKEFRNLGYLDALKHLTKILKGKELSLENMNEDLSQDTLQSIYDSTLDNDGGTFDLRTGKSLVGDDRVKNIYSVEFKSYDWNKRIGQVDKQEVLNAIETLLRSELVKDADGIGTWSSGKDERPQSSVGLDKFFKDREEAEKFALEHKQKAIGVFDSNGEYSDTIYKKDFKYKPHKEEEPKVEPKVEPQEQDKEEK